MKITTKQILAVLHILAWIIFIGLCIQAGGFSTNAVFALVNPSIVPRLWKEVDLTNLFEFNTMFFFIIMFTMSMVAILKALLFYQIIIVILEKRIHLDQPFNETLGRFILRVCYLSLLIGLFSLYGVEYSKWLITKGVIMPDTQDLHFGGPDVWLFMSVILFVIAQIFKRGMEIQSENELTV